MTYRFRNHFPKYIEDAGLYEACYSLLHELTSDSYFADEVVSENLDDWSRRDANNLVDIICSVANGYNEAKADLLSIPY